MKIVRLVLVFALIGVARLGYGQPRPVVMAHYLPWFEAKPYSSAWGWHWTMAHFNPDLVIDGRRQIASHLYPAIGPYDSRDPDVIEYHGLLMKLSGIDGVILDWYGASSLYDYPLIDQATDRVVAEARRLGLKVAICYEDGSVQAQIDAGTLAANDAIARGQADLQSVRSRWMADSTYLTLNGRPVVLNFGAVRFKTSGAWALVFSGFDPQPAFFSEDVRLAPTALGAYPWPPMWASVGGVLTTERMNAYLAEFESRSAPWPARITGAWPGFHDIYAEAGVHPSYGFLDDRDGATFRETLDRALGLNAPMVQLVTWNDHGEGTAIEPTMERGTRDLEAVQSRIAARRPLPFDADDLPLARAIYDGRKRYPADAIRQAQLDDAVARIVAGDPVGARSILSALTGVRPERIASVGATLSVSPNPTLGSVSVQLDLAGPAPVRLDVFNVLGQRVATLTDGALPAGRRAFTWTPTGLPGGTYYVRLQSPGRPSVTQRVTLIGR